MIDKKDKAGLPRRGGPALRQKRGEERGTYWEMPAIGSVSAAVKCPPSVPALN